MPRVSTESALSSLAGSSSVLRQFISPERSPGKFFIDAAVKKEWRPTLIRPESIWAMEFRKHSAAFLAIELRNFIAFDRLARLSIGDARELARPLGAWIASLPHVQLFDQIGGFDRRLGHWHFLYRQKKIAGSLDIFIFRQKAPAALLLASISEHQAF